jgi:outer membrane immunogenic protein
MTSKTKTHALLGAACGVALGALAAVAPAMAADMGAPVYKAAPAAAVFNWTGFYLGGSVGGGMASLPVTDLDNFAPFLNGPALKSTGVVGGVHAGYNWQFAPSFLVGIEGDFNWSSFKDSDTTCFTGSCSDPRSNQLVASSKLDQFATLRARFGLTSDRTLLYVTAGPAWGHIDASLTESNCVDPSCSRFGRVPGQLLAAASDSSYHIGIAVGAGVEYALTQNWILRGEYLHLDFSNSDATFSTVPNLSGDPNARFRARSTATADLARIGVSYKIW